MRDAFVERLVELAREDQSIELLTGDLGFGVLRSFKNEFPERFHNVGIAEQLMIEMAAGMALAGKKVVCYSIGNFPVLRCLEQIRNDVAYANADVKIVEVGGGFTYGQLGMSHNATEDLACLLPIPNLSIYAPADKNEAKVCADLMIKEKGPGFIRLERPSNVTIQDSGDYRLLIGGKPMLAVSGKRVALLSYGSIACSLTSLAKKKNYALFTMPVLKPINETLFHRSLSRFKRIIVIEEHSEIGGYYSFLSSIKSLAKKEITSIALRSEFPVTIGDQEYVRAISGLDPIDIERRIEEAAK